ncbi:purine and uridine phosphorylase [Penicillium crustosum]|uniref:purine and uridine phosphorylase n=1 Tax=Penicillium crustosum TaxID=36656 RepID=UPI0023859206|nr:purine and uridine phosphorylase [Penicillium crustosum]KAJ5419556.1 purine and uridine phosphorylase [Penicillium crustosum]
MGDRGQESATLAHEDYTVGWVCALPKEIVAAKAMLDQVHPPLPQPPHDSNNYTLGRVGSHNVVIACLPLGELGNNSSASVATRLNSTFPGIKFGIMVGIGGGVPPSVRLGDVVVSAPSNEFGGVVQWDFGKTEQGTGFRRTGSLNSPPTILKTALSMLQAKHEMEGSVVPKFLEEVERKWPMLVPRYTRRENLEDMLFPADFQHVIIQDAGEGQSHCSGCDRSKLLQRKHRDMRIHYGLIASGNQVVKDGIFRDQINSRFGGNVLCFEMEAAGLMNEFRCVVVRGICDYADSHKPKHWQEYAAAVAAATAKEILLMVPKWDVLTMAPMAIPNHRRNTNLDTASLKGKGKEDLISLLPGPELTVGTIGASRRIEHQEPLRKISDLDGTAGYDRALGKGLIISIDFGTTYSGVSWATVADFKHESINVITKWPGSDSERVKVPTKLCYEYSEILWGFQVPSDADSLQYLKLLLLQDDDIQDELRESMEFGRTKRTLRENGITAEDCIADYLRAIWKHTLETIRQARPKYGIDALKFHAVLTVPITWKEYARNAMKRAASKAGILDYRIAGPTSLTVVPEPEAAGLAALVDRGSYVEAGNVFVVCDAGGGLCGGIFIDEAFILQCKNRIGRNWSHYRAADIVNILTKEWEYGIKPRYAERNGPDSYPLFIMQPPLPDLKMNDVSRKPHIKHKYIYFSGSDIRKAFHARAVPGLLKLVDTQLSKARNKGLNVTGILLAGGLGSSPHIHECLEAKYSNRGIDIHQSAATGA